MQTLTTLASVVAPHFAIVPLPRADRAIVHPEPNRNADISSA